MCIYVTKIQSQLYLICEYLLLYCNICFIIRDAYLDYILYLNSDLFFMKKWIENESKIFLYEASFSRKSILKIYCLSIVNFELSNFYKIL